MLQLNMEQAILSQYRRLPGFHSEFVGLEVMGMHNEQIGFEDVLNGIFRPSLCFSNARVVVCAGSSAVIEILAQLF
jgi:hypothetical protein